MRPILLLLGCGPGTVPLTDAPVTPGVPLTASASGAAWTVDCAGGGDFRTIGDAIEAAESGDVIAVKPCDYEESIDFDGKTLKIESTDGRETTILRGSSGSAVVTADHGEGDGTGLYGFTIDGGGGYGAVFAELSSMRLEDVLLTGSKGYAAVYGASADLELVDVEIEDITGSEGAVYADRGTVSADELDIQCGRGAGVYVTHGALFLDHTTLDCTGKTGLYAFHSGGKALRTVVDGNLSMEQEDDHYEESVDLENVIVHGNITQTYGSFHFRNSVLDGAVSLTTVYTETTIESSVLMNAKACALTADTSDFTVRNTDFYANGQDSCTGVEYVGVADNVSVDPGFVDEAGDDYSLQPGSPLVDAGPLDDGWADPDGSRNDIGAYGGPHSLGGGW